MKTKTSLENPTIRSAPRLWAAAMVMSLVLLPGREPSAQTQVPSWDTVVKALKVRKNAVSSYSAHYRTDIVHSPDSIKTALDESRKASGPAPLPREYSIANRVYTSSLSRKGPKWRADVTETYPALEDGRSVKNFAGYDGENYFAYDDRRELGHISSTVSGLHTDPSVLQSDIPQLGIVFPLSDIEQAQIQGSKFVLEGEDTTNGERCLRYGTTGAGGEASFRYTLWVSPAKGFAVVKFKDEEFLTGDKGNLQQGTIVIFSVQSFVEPEKGIFLTKRSKKEFYVVEGGKSKWQRTSSFTLNDISINEELDERLFVPRFAPGVSVQNEVLSPGRLSTEGGDYEAAVRAVAEGTRPKTELAEDSAVALPEKATGTKRAPQ